MLKRVLVPLTLALLGGLSLLFLDEKPASSAPTVPNGFSDSTFASGLSRPTAMAFAPDGRLFVTEQGGKVRIIKPPGSGQTQGTLLSTPFVDLTSITDSTGERGLLGIAFDPYFNYNGQVYVYHTLKATSTTPARNRVLRLTASGDTAVSAKLIFDLNDLGSAKNHNGGAIHFGDDKRLYVAVGDNTVGSNAQTLANLFGKMLRINLDGSIPPDNPFYGFASGKNKAIWAAGLRNPYSFAFQPGTGKMFINDVGLATWEEINQGIKGYNYGWPVYEGPETDSKYTSPLFAYRHGNTATTGCAITGGTFYNPTTRQFPPEYEGDYFFADFCSGWIRRLDPTTRSATGFATGLIYPVDLQVGPDGALYYLVRGNTTAGGSVGRIQHGTTG